MRNEAGDMSSMTHAVDTAFLAPATAAAVIVGLLWLVLGVGAVAAAAVAVCCCCPGYYVHRQVLFLLLLYNYI